MSSKNKQTFIIYKIILNLNPLSMMLFGIRGHSTTTWTRRGGRGGPLNVHACLPRGGVPVDHSSISVSVLELNFFPKPKLLHVFPFLGGKD